MGIQRMVLKEAFPEGYLAVTGLEKANRTGPIEAPLYELVKIRASQINGCAFCLNMHHRDARKGGESQQRLDVLPAWREVELFSDRERAALALTEAVTLISEDCRDSDHQRVEPVRDLHPAAAGTRRDFGIGGRARCRTPSRPTTPAAAIRSR